MLCECVVVVVVVKVVVEVVVVAHLQDSRGVHELHLQEALAGHRAVRQRAEHGEVLVRVLRLGWRRWGGRAGGEHTDHGRNKQCYSPRVLAGGC